MNLVRRSKSNGGDAYRDGNNSPKLWGFSFPKSGISMEMNSVLPPGLDGNDLFERER